MTQAQQTGRKPTHRLFTVTGDGDKANWTQIGAVWPHQDGKGFNLALTALPIDGRIVMREADKTEDNGGQQ